MKHALPTSLTLFAAIIAMLWILLLLSSAHSDFFAQYSALVLVATSILALLLLILVGWQLFSLWQDYKNRVFGARLKWRLLLIFGAIAILPGVLVYGTSIQFINRAIENWFDVRVEKALDSGVQLGQTALDSLLDEQSEKTRTMAQTLSTANATQQRFMLLNLIETHSVQSAGIFNSNGNLISSADSGVLTQKTLNKLPDLTDLRLAKNQTIKRIESFENALFLRVLSPIKTHSANFLGETYILQTLQNVPLLLLDNIDEVQVAYRDYKELQTARIGLNRIYMMTLTLTVLVALFSAFTMAYYMARRLIAPLHILAEGTKAVAQGDFSPRKTVKSGDEFGILTQSFQRMTSQLKEARFETERHRTEVENARAYLESILAHVSTGVLVFDSQFMLRKTNGAASSILKDDFLQLCHTPLSNWARQNELAQTIIQEFKNQNAQETWQEQLEMNQKVLLLRGSSLPDNMGYVVVFDDITRLIASERDAAWGEVARRLAHEIKNPLTPIQLSAERLQLKLSAHLNEQDSKILQRSTQTIINQVEAMKAMVNDFRDYAKLPAPKLQNLNLNALIEEILGLYENTHAQIFCQLEENLPEILGDATQIRQVIHNLLNNAEDALENKTNGIISIATHIAKPYVELSICDNGDGFALNLLNRIFEPYITTKARGTGLGLSIVKKIIEEHHGFIEVGNAPNAGARIKIRLPLAMRRE